MDFFSSITRWSHSNLFQDQYLVKWTDQTYVQLNWVPRELLEVEYKPQINWYEKKLAKQAMNTAKVDVLVEKICSTNIESPSKSSSISQSEADSVADTADNVVNNEQVAVEIKEENLVSDQPEVNNDTTAGDDESIARANELVTLQVLPKRRRKQSMNSLLSDESVNDHMVVPTGRIMTRRASKRSMSVMFEPMTATTSTPGAPVIMTIAQAPKKIRRMTMETTTVGSQLDTATSEAETSEAAATLSPIKIEIEESSDESGDDNDETENNEESSDEDDDEVDPLTPKKIIAPISRAYDGVILFLVEWVEKDADPGYMTNKELSEHSPEVLIEFYQSNLKFEEDVNTCN